MTKIIKGAWLPAQYFLLHFNCSGNVLCSKFIFIIILFNYLKVVP